MLHVMGMARLATHTAQGTGGYSARLALCNGSGIPGRLGAQSKPTLGLMHKVSVALVPYAPQTDPQY